MFRQRFIILGEKKKTFDFLIFTHQRFLLRQSRMRIEGERNRWKRQGIYVVIILTKVDEQTSVAFALVGRKREYAGDVIVEEGIFLLQQAKEHFFIASFIARFDEYPSRVASIVYKESRATRRISHSRRRRRKGRKGKKNNVSPS